MDEIVPSRSGLPARRFDESFIGRGIAWPLRVDHTGSIAMTSGAADLDDSLRMILMTAPGERLMRPQFGCRIWDLLFEPVTPNLIGLISEAVRDAVAQWEPRVAVESVTALPSDDDHALIRIHIMYVVRSTNDRRNLVYPFYVIPHEEN
jgi:phage baseplate assembly protein W